MVVLIALIRIILSLHWFSFLSLLLRVKQIQSVNLVQSSDFVFMDSMPGKAV